MVSAIERMDPMQKRLRIMLFGAFLLCVLLAGFFTFNHIAGPAHASSPNDHTYYLMGAQDGYLACYNQKHNLRVPPLKSVGDEQGNYDNGWTYGYYRQGGCK
jgi:hypothetical protein